jgi:hypothetical protein
MSLAVEATVDTPTFPLESLDGALTMQGQREGSEIFSHPSASEMALRFLPSFLVVTEPLPAHSRLSMVMVQSWASAPYPRSSPVEDGPLAEIGLALASFYPL